MQKKQNSPTKNKFWVFIKNNFLFKSLINTFMFAGVLSVYIFLTYIFGSIDIDRYFLQSTINFIIFFFGINFLFYSAKSLFSYIKRRWRTGINVLFYVAKSLFSYIKHRWKRSFAIIFLIGLFLFGANKFILYVSSERTFTNCNPEGWHNTCYDDIPCPIYEEFFRCDEGIVSVSFPWFSVLNVDDNNKIFTKVGSFWYLKNGYYSKKEVWSDGSVHYMIY